jgi:peptidoglycan/LPS O-acetylase OafA/YrhL
MVRSATMSYEPAARPPARDARRLQGHIPALDGIRGLAILMVLVLHFFGNATPTNRVEELVVSAIGCGSYGVDLFFVLSGFLITGILYDAPREPHFFRNFYLRRVLRIFPLYYGVLAVIFLVLPVVPAMRGPELDALVAHQAWAWLYGVNVFNALQSDWALPYIDHFWSLAVEEHFYFVWPFFVYALASRPRALMAASAGVALLALASRVGCSVAGLGAHALYVLTPFRLDGLATGAFLAVLGRQPGGLDRIARSIPKVVATTVTFLIARSAWVHSVGTGVAVLKPMRESAVMVLLACFLMMAVMSHPGTLLVRFFTHRAMTFLGTYSYGLYVHHHFVSYYASTRNAEAWLTVRLGSHSVAVLAQGAIGLAISMAAAWVSFEWYEKRFLSLKRRFAS